MLNIAAGEGVAPPPFDPLAFRVARGVAGGRGRPRRNPAAGAPVLERRTRTVPHGVPVAEPTAMAISLALLA